MNAEEKKKLSKFFLVMPSRRNFALADVTTEKINRHRLPGKYRDGIFSSQKKSIVRQETH